MTPRGRHDRRAALAALALCAGAASPVTEAARISPERAVTPPQLPLVALDELPPLMVFDKLPPSGRGKLSAAEVAAIEAAHGLPSAFDARDTWPGCVGEVRNQGQCGSCWAFAATETLADRWCIATNGAEKVVLSPQNLMDCETLNLGCTMGSLPQWAWSFLESHGVLSEACVRYEAHTELHCAKECPTQADTRHYHATNVTHLAPLVHPEEHVADIMRAVMSGPVDATFNVYADFGPYWQFASTEVPAYGRVYKKKGGSYKGLHSVKVVGWGTDEKEGCV